MKKLRALLLGILIWIIYSLLRLTWKVYFHEPQELQQFLLQRNSFLLAHWHGDEIPLLQIGRRFRLATMSSISTDGEMMNVILYLLGVKTSRGSSSRRSIGGLLGLIRLIKSGRNCSFAVDGPKGPIYEVKPGILEISRTLQLPIVTAAAHCDHAWHFPRSWNKAYLPKPFAHVHLVFQIASPPILKNSDPRAQESRDRIKQSIIAAKQQAIKFVAEDYAQC